MATASARAGKMLRVDLSSGRIEPLETAPYARRYLGGRGLATAIYWDEVPATCRFDDEANRLIVAAGPLAGIPGGLGGSRWGVFGKSPFPAPLHGGRDHLCYGNLGGRLGAELRFAGWEGLVVQGKADRPVWIAIEDDRVELRPAEDLWGRTTVETMALVGERAAPRSKVMAIGPAGEHLVPLATVFADGDASCSGGMGAVMGAKNLKAVAVRGSSRKVEVADPEALRAIEREVRAAGRGNVKVWGMDFMAHGSKTRKYPCHGCMGHCLRVKYRADDGTAGKFMCQSRFFYVPLAWGYYGEDNDVPFFANRRCDEAGIDTWEVQALVEWLLACRAEGVLDAAETGLDLDKVGSLAFIEDLVRITSRREGFGELLCRGALAAARARGGRAGELFTRTDPYDPRYCTVNTLLFPFETREPIQQLHEAGLVLSQWSSWAKGVEEAHISSEVLRGIARRFWGSAEAADMTTLEGKARAAMRIQERQLAKECIGVCDWMFPLIDKPKGEDHVGDPTVESRIVSAALGERLTEGDLYTVGERVFNIQRAVLLREGHRARVDDVLPHGWHERGIDTHVADPEVLAPGPEGEVVSQLGRRAAMPEYLRLRDEYYELRGWDVPTGLQSRELLAALRMEDVAEELLGQGLAVERSRSTPLRARLGHGLTAARTRVGRALAGRTGKNGASGPSLGVEELERILNEDQQKFGHEAIRHNFAGWTKTMLYTFPDLGQHWVIRFDDGVAQAPARVEGAPPRAEIVYEMDSWVLAAMARGELSGEQAYLKRHLRMKASFGDMMKLQSLATV